MSPLKSRNANYILRRYVHTCMPTSGTQYGTTAHLRRTFAHIWEQKSSRRLEMHYKRKLMTKQIPSEGTIMNSLEPKSTIRKNSLVAIQQSTSRQLNAQGRILHNCRNCNSRKYAVIGRRRRRVGENSSPSTNSPYYLQIAIIQLLMKYVPECAQRHSYIALREITALRCTALSWEFTMLINAYCIRFRWKSWKEIARALANRTNNIRNAATLIGEKMKSS